MTILFITEFKVYIAVIRARTVFKIGHILVQKLKLLNLGSYLGSVSVREKKKTLL